MRDLPEQAVTHGRHAINQVDEHVIDRTVVAAVENQDLAPTGGGAGNQRSTKRLASNEADKANCQYGRLKRRWPAPRRRHTASSDGSMAV